MPLPYRATLVARSRASSDVRNADRAGEDSASANTVFPRDAWSATLSLGGRRRISVFAFVPHLVRLLAVSGGSRSHETGRERVAQVARNLETTLGEAAMIAGLVHEVGRASCGFVRPGEQAAAQLPSCPLVATATAGGYASGAVPVDPAP
jgi:hypothetical protein